MNSPTSRDRPRIAIVGCGAIAERYHLPALATLSDRLMSVVLVDPDANRLRHLAGKFDIRFCETDYRTVLDRVDGAIVATPHRTHHPIAMDFLVRGVHVLCEKPLTESVAHAEEMVECARVAGVTLGVNQTRRLFPAYQEVKRYIEDGKLGELRSIEYSDGESFEWPTASGFYFQEGSGGGVLFDRGVHGLDAICWWLGETPEVVASKNDSFGGLEGTALLELRHERAAIKLQLSWLSKLDNRYRVSGELGSIEGEIEGWDGFTHRDLHGTRRRIKVDADAKVYDDFGPPMLENFVDAIAGTARPVAPAQEAIAPLEVITEAYDRAERFDLPWMRVLDESRAG